MSIGFLVTMSLLTIGLWALLHLIRRHAPRVRMRPRAPISARGPASSGLSAAERRRLYRRLGLDPSTLRNASARGGIRLRMVSLRRGDID